MLEIMFNYVNKRGPQLAKFYKYWAYYTKVAEIFTFWKFVYLVIWYHDVVFHHCKTFAYTLTATLLTHVQNFMRHDPYIKIYVKKKIHLLKVSQAMDG